MPKMPDEDQIAPFEGREQFGPRREIALVGAQNDIRYYAELGRTATRAALKHEAVVIGTATDPHRPAERRFRVTRGVLEVLEEQSGIGVAVITKSPLVPCDIALLTRINERSRLSVHVSLIAIDRELA